MNALTISKTALFVGAGAVENAWTPVCAAVEKHSGRPADSDTATCYLAQQVYSMRFFSVIGSLDGIEDEQTPHRFWEFKNILSAELLSAEASGQLKARAELSWVLKNLVMPWSPLFYLISTNWDTVVERAIEEICVGYQDFAVRPFHLHGQSSAPGSLYLPTEWLGEPYRKTAEVEEMGGLHRGLIERLCDLEHLIIYGLSLSPLDSELARTISALIDHHKITTVAIVDCDPDTVEKRILNLIKNSGSVQISKYVPRSCRKTPQKRSAF